MSGYMAFEHETPMEFAKKVLNTEWSMDFEDEDQSESDEDSNPFDSISEEGKDFVNQLIRSNPSDRLSATNAISHSWLKQKNDRGIFRRASSRALILNTARKNLKRIQARRRWRNAIHVVQATCKMNRLGRQASSARLQL